MSRTYAALLWHGRSWRPCSALSFGIVNLPARFARSHGEPAIKALPAADRIARVLQRGVGGSKYPAATCD
jgi:hypothetical protein